MLHFIDLARYRSLEETADAQLPTYFCVHPLSTSNNEVPSRWARFSTRGIAVGSLNCAKSDVAELLVEEWCVRSSKVAADGSSYPIGLALTEHHVLVVYADRLIAYSLLTQRKVYEDVFSVEFFRLTAYFLYKPAHICRIIREQSASRVTPQQAIFGCIRSARSLIIGPSMRRAMFGAFSLSRANLRERAKLRARWPTKRRINS